MKSYVSVCKSFNFATHIINPQMISITLTKFYYLNKVFVFSNYYTICIRFSICMYALTPLLVLYNSYHRFSPRTTTCTTLQCDRKDGQGRAAHIMAATQK